MAVSRCLPPALGAALNNRVMIRAVDPLEKNRIATGRDALFPMDVKRNDLAVVTFWDGFVVR